MKRFIAISVIGTFCFAALGDSQSEIALSKIIQRQAKEIQALKAEIKTLKQGKKTTSTKVPLSSAALQKISTLKSKIAVLNKKIKDCQFKIRNVKYKILKMTDEDRKGWYYRKSGSSRSLHSMSTLPRNWNRKTVRIVYISKDEKRQKLTKEYQEELAKLEKQKQDLTKELAAIN